MTVFYWVLIVVLFILFISLKVVKQYEHAVIFFFGKIYGHAPSRPYLSDSDL